MNKEKARALIAENCVDDVLNEYVPHGWMCNDTFWYIEELAEEKRIILRINSVKDGTLQSFELDNFALHTCFPVTRSIKKVFKKDACFMMACEINGVAYTYNLDKLQVEDQFNVHSYEGHAASYSPCRSQVIYKKEHELFLKKLPDDQEIRLTEDGSETRSYCGHSGNNNSTVRKKIEGDQESLGIMWLEKVHKFLFYQLLDEGVEAFSVMQTFDNDKPLDRPVTHSFRYAITGDAAIPRMKVFIGDSEDGSVQEIPVPSINFNFAPVITEGFYKIAVTDNQEEAIIPVMSRDYKTIDLYRVDLMTADVKPLLTEVTDTFHFYDSYGEIDGYDSLAYPIHFFKNKRHFIWKAVHNDWYHFEVRCLDTGKKVRQLTEGDFNVERLLRIDEEKNRLFFTVSHKNKEVHPYYEFGYTVDMEGNLSTPFTFPDADHLLCLSPNGDYGLDSYSRVDLPPVFSLVCTRSGIEEKLVEASIDCLLEKGYQLPSIEVVEGDHYSFVSLLIPPSNRTDGQTYPLIDYVYGGPQTVNVPKRFSTSVLFEDSFGGLQSLCQLGFGGCIIDGRGTPRQSKSFHDFSYQNLEGAAGLEDHPIVIEKLAEKYDWIDLNRIGAWGASGGGYATVRALAHYPEFYKVGVAIAGNHNQLLYNYTWVERYNGFHEKDSPLLKQQDNNTIVEKIEGKLLLVHGELDDNVHISHTIQLYSSCVRNNVDAELMIVPHEFHAVSRNKLVIEKKWDYFIKYLIAPC